jgi:hypothetical protein
MGLNSNVQIKRSTLDRLKRYRAVSGTTATHIDDASINEYLDRKGFEKDRAIPSLNGTPKTKT